MSSVSSTNTNENSYFLFSHLYLELKQKKSKKPAHYSFLPCSTNSFCLFLHLPRGKCNISCDTSTSLPAGRRPASIQLHQSTSILQRDTLPTFCAQRSWLSLRCGPLRSQDSQADANTNIIPYKHFPNAQLSAKFICLCSSTDSPRSLSTVHAQS